uniref:type II toxin-antitoxin system RelE/ParE family toxin n=1 Tax=Stappia sp. TaxID=1870903 RepID=UPI003BA8E47F
MSAKRGILLLEWSSEAEEDVVSIIGYIYARNPEAARELLDLIDEKIAGLRVNARMYRKGRVSGTREMVIKRICVVIYEESDERVKVLRVLHTARKWP